MNNTNNQSARQSYDIAKQILFNAWIGSFKGDVAACNAWVNGRKLSQSELRLEVELNTTSNRFVFGLTPNQSNSTNVVFPTEQRLNLQDSLVVSEYTIYVALPASRTATAFALHTYGNTQVFSAAQAAAIDNGLYCNSWLETRVNNDVIIPYRRLMNHWYKPQTQQTAALGAGSPGDQIRGAEDGFITQEPNLLLIGSKNYIPEIVMPGALASVAEFTRAILVYQGVLAQNSTVIN
jgi:hypothetical protein